MATKGWIFMNIEAVPAPTLATPLFHQNPAIPCAMIPAKINKIHIKREWLMTEPLTKFSTPAAGIISTLPSTVEYIVIINVFIVFDKPRINNILIERQSMAISMLKSPHEIPKPPFATPIIEKTPIKLIMAPADFLMVNLTLKMIRSNKIVAIGAKEIINEALAGVV